MFQDEEEEKYPRLSERFFKTLLSSDIR
jgi:hypothetical protein